MEQTKETLSEKQSAYDEAFAEAEAAREALTKAEAEREAAIRQAEGEAEAILKVQKARAEGIRMINEANPGKAYLTIQSLEALEKVADGKATKLIIPSEIQGIAGLAASIKEMVTPEEK